MKQQDIAVIGAVVFFAIVVSLIASNILFPTGKKNIQQVEKVDQITADFPSPTTDISYKKYFNEESVDPTQTIRIGENTNSSPFNGANQ